MCGLAGAFYLTDVLSAGRLDDVLERMIGTIVHRGPDDKGVWCDAQSGIGLGFRRLSILDLSEAGHQPMRSASGRFTVVFNGEVYNFGELSEELRADGVRFRGHSDTEVILAAFDRWGVEAAVRRFAGMFAIALWDADKRRLSLIRDQVGIKPLYVYQKAGVVAFASEIKALREIPGFDDTIDSDALGAFLRYLYIPAPASIFRHVSKLRPGHVLHITDPGAPLPEAEPYWTAMEAAQRGLSNPFDGSDAEAVDQLERLLTNSVRLQMQSDVPLGALLSGGVDSSLVVALMQAGSGRQVETFSIGFDSPEFNEAPFAARVATHLGTKHTQLMLTDADALNVVPMLPDIYDEPFADSSQIPTFLVCQLARRQVTVALAGDGGDELFAGYHRYLRGSRLAAWLRRTPRVARAAIADAIGRVSPSTWDRVASSRALPGALRQHRAGDKLHRLAFLVNSTDERTMYRSLVSAWQRPGDVVRGGKDPATDFDALLRASSVPGLIDRMLLADLGVYLPDDLLAKTDRASMATSLEVRVPLLDHRVVEFSWRIPMSMKIRDGRGKWLLRQVLHRHVPMELVDRPKMGFEVPIEAWLRGRLRAWGEALLSDDQFLNGELDAVVVRRAWDDLQAGRSGMSHRLWAVLMYQAWKKKWMA